MSTLYRLILALIVIAGMIVGCQTTATPTPIPVTNTPVPSTNTPVLATATPVPPTNTPIPATDTPVPEQSTSSMVISVDTASQLKKIASLELPESMLNTIVFAPDNHTMISADMNGEVTLWERGTWKKAAFLAPQSDFKRDDDGKANFSGTLALSPNGKMIVTTNSDGEVKGLDWDGKERFTFPLGDRVYSTSISPDGKYLAAGGLSKKLIIVDLETNQQIADLSSDYEYISNLVFSPDSKTLLASYERPGNVMKTWDTATWKEIATFSHTTERFDYHDILFTPDGKSLVIASTRNDIEFLDLETKQVVKKLQGHPRAPYQIAFSPDGSLLASASDDMTLRLWDVKTGKAVLVLRNQHEVGMVAFSPDGTLLAFGVWGEGFQVWAMDGAAASVPAPTASVTATQPLGDNGGLIAFVSDQDGKPAIYVMNADGSNQRRLAEANPKGICRPPVWSPDGQRIAYLVIPNGERDLHGPLEVWSVGLDGAAPIELSAGVTDTLLAYPSIDPTWSPDGTRLAVAALHPVAGTSDKRSVVTILRSDGSGVEQAFPLDWIASGVEWASNGEQILIQDRSPDESVWAHNAHVLSLSNGEIREVYRDLLSAAFSPDGTEIAVVPAQSEQVLIVKLDGTSRPVGPLPAGTTPELAVWSPDGATITVFGTTNNREEAGLYLVTVSTGQVRHTALVAEYLDDLEYSPDGKQLLVSATHPGSSSRSTRWLNRSLLVYDLASATLTALTDGKGYDTHASWAPTPTASVTATQPLGDNGAGLIAFLSDRDGKPAIYVMNADGSNQRRLAGGKPGDTCLRPVWSPDGQRIAYIVVPNGLSGDRHGPLEVWSAGLDGAAPIELSAGVTDTLLAYPWNDPTWSPDGTRLAIAALHPVAGTSDKRSVLTILRSNGSGVEQAFPLDWIAGAVEWASNGEQILIEDISPDESVRAHNAHVLSLSNGKIREVYRDIISAAFSPDGTEIAVVPAQSRQVLIVKLDGTSRPVGPLPAGTMPELAVWSPDGATIAVFGTTKNREEASLYLVTISTGQVKRIALVAESLHGLEYSPDGKQLLVSTAHPGRSSHSNRWPKSTLWVYDLASETLTALTDGKGYDSHGTWAPVSTASTAPATTAPTVSSTTVSQVKLQTKLRGHTGHVFSVAFSSDGRLLASAGQNNEVKLWNLAAQQEIKSFNHSGGGKFSSWRMTSNWL